MWTTVHEHTPCFDARAFQDVHAGSTLPPVTVNAIENT
jgi:hypothetical protein